MTHLKESRKAKGYTLKEVSDATGYTKSFISQLERGLKRPSLESLRKIAAFLEVPITTLMEDCNEAGEAKGDCTVLLPQMHSMIRLSDQSPVLYETLTPDTGTQGLKGYVCHIAPGESSSGKQVTHRHVECAYVMEGCMTALIGDAQYTVPAGGSIYVESSVPHNYRNDTSSPLTLIGFFHV